MSDNYKSICNESSVEYLTELLELKNVDLEHIGKSLGEIENKWYKLLETVETKSIGLQLLENLQKTSKQLKDRDCFYKYINTKVREKEYEVIMRLIPLVAENSSDKTEMLYKYTIEVIGLKNYGLRTLPIIPKYENVKDENIVDMLKILEIENEVDFINFEK